MKSILLLILLGIAGIASAGGDSGIIENDKRDELYDKWQYPSDGVLQHTVIIDILRDGNSVDIPSPPPNELGGGELTEPGEDPHSKDEKGSETYSVFSPHPTESPTIIAESGWLVTQILRQFLVENGYQMDFRAKYDCRLQSNVSFTGESFPETLGQFLRLFSLSAKISGSSKVVSIFPAGSTAKICQPATEFVVVEN